MKCLRNFRLRAAPRWSYELECDIWIPPSYPDRPIGKHQFDAVGGFRQHPNSSPSM